MYKHILISTDGSELAQKGIDHGLALAKALGARVTVITVTERFPLTSTAAGAGWVPSSSDIEGYEASQKEHAERVLAGIGGQAAGLGVAVETVHVPESWPSEAIIETAKTRGCDVIVMASHGRRGLGRLLLGSQTSEVLTHTTLPVLVVR